MSMSWLERGVVTGALVVLVAGVAFALFTALGVGGGDAAVTTPTAPEQRQRHLTPLQQYSQEASRRESGVALPGQPALADHFPIPVRAFRRPMAAYLAYAVRRTTELLGDTARLTAALRAGDRRAARAAWRVAFARYLRLGAVYGLFGDLDQRIDGLPGGLPRHTHDPKFTGLHRIELGLWTHASPRSLVPYAVRLRADLRRLRRVIPRTEMDPLDYATRAHEILEDAQRDFLSGTAVPWSGEGVLATQSGLDATDYVISTLRPILDGQDATPEVLAALHRLRTTLAVLRHAHGGRLPTNGELRLREREQLDGILGAALSALQRVPDALATSDPPQIPALPSP